MSVTVQILVVFCLLMFSAYSLGRAQEENKQQKYICKKLDELIEMLRSINGNIYLNSRKR